MIKSNRNLALILVSLTLQPRAHCTDMIQSIKSVGVCSAFGIILPAVFGMGSHFLEEHVGIITPAQWREDNHLKIEATKLMQTAFVSSVSALTWCILRGVVDNDIRASLVMTSLYCYGQGRALYRTTPSQLLKATSYCLPAAVVMLGYTRIPELSPQLDLAGKSILVFGLAHICGA